jgi:hypothetical protein
MEHQVTTEERNQQAVSSEDVASTTTQRPDWRKAIANLREMFRDGPSLEDDFLAQRRAEKW